MGNPKPQLGHLTSVAIFIKGNKMQITELKGMIDKQWL
jgi:hypothetical protein